MEAAESIQNDNQSIFYAISEPISNHVSVAVFTKDTATYCAPIERSPPLELIVTVPSTGAKVIFPVPNCAILIVVPTG